MPILTTGVSQTGLSRAGRCGPCVQWASSTAYPQRWPSATPYTPALLSIESEHPGKTGCSPLCDPSLGLKRRRKRTVWVSASKIQWGFSPVALTQAGGPWHQILKHLYTTEHITKIKHATIFVFHLAAQWWSLSAAWVWGRSWCGRAGSGTYGRSGAQQTPPGRPPTTGRIGWCSVPSPSHSFPLTAACETPRRDR